MKALSNLCSGKQMLGVARLSVDPSLRSIQILKFIHATVTQNLMCHLHKNVLCLDRTIILSSLYSFFLHKEESSYIL